MLTGRLCWKSVTIDVFCRRGATHDLQDRWFVQNLEVAGHEVLRVAVIDGVTPWSASEETDQAQKACAVVIGELHQPVPLAQAMAEANRKLHDPSLEISRKQAMAAIAAIDVRVAGNASAKSLHFCSVVAADCEIWTRDRVATRRFDGGDFLTTSARQRHDALEREHSGDSERRRLLQSLLVDESGSQTRTAVGRYRVPRFSHREGSAEQILLFTDGAAAACRDGRSLIETFRQAERDVTRDDSTAILISLAEPV